MLRQIRTIGIGSVIVILVTLVLFIAALFLKGFTHDLLLEAAVFLVSVKLIILSYRTSESVKEIQDKLDHILSEEIHLENLVTSLKQSKKNKSKQ
jgi:hypothetical protein